MSEKKKLAIGTNLLLSVLVLFIGVVCFFPVSVTAAKQEDNVYRQGDTSSNGVSLLINVYWGTQEVYDMLSILKEYDAKATFFIGGCWADDNVECLKKIAEDGHEIGSHGYFHKECDKLNSAQVREEITRSRQFITLATGREVTLFAPPSGAYNAKTAEICKEEGMRLILWSKDTIDWRDKDAELCLKRATQKVSGGDFILMHPMSETVKALPNILEYYKVNGLVTKTVTENLAYGG